MGTSMIYHFEDWRFRGNIGEYFPLERYQDLISLSLGAARVIDGWRVRGDALELLRRDIFGGDYAELPF